MRFGEHQVSLRGRRIDLQRGARLFFARCKISRKGTDECQVQPLPHSLGDNLNCVLRRFQCLGRVAQLRIAIGKVVLTDAIGGVASDELRKFLNAILPVARGVDSTSRGCDSVPARSCGPHVPSPASCTLRRPRVFPDSGPWPPCRCTPVQTSDPVPRPSGTNRTPPGTCPRTVRRHRERPGGRPPAMRR